MALVDEDSLNDIDLEDINMSYCSWIALGLWCYFVKYYGYLFLIDDLLKLDVYLFWNEMVDDLILNYQFLYVYNICIM